MRYSILFLSIILIVAACSASKKTANNNQTRTTCQEMKLLEVPLDSLRFDYFTIDSLFIKDECLEIKVNYGGGCGEANFDLYLSDRIMESMPPKTLIYLTFNDQDPCRSIVQKKLRYSLKPLKRFADRGGIYLKIAGTEKSVLYQIPK